MEFGEDGLVGIVIGLGEGDEDDFVEGGVGLKEVAGGGEGDAGGFFDGEAVDSGADGGEGDGADFVVEGEFEGVAIAVGEQSAFITVAAAPDRAGSMNDKFGGELITLGNFGFPDFAAVEFATFGKQFGANSAVDGPVDPASTEEGGVGGVDDGINGLLGKVAEQEGESIQEEA